MDFFTPHPYDSIRWDASHDFVCTIRLRDGTLASVRDEDTRHASASGGDKMITLVRHERGCELLFREQGLQVLSVLLARNNFKRATPEHLLTAYHRIRQSGGIERAWSSWLHPDLILKTTGPLASYRGKLSDLRPELSVALEVGIHEELERRFLGAEAAGKRDVAVFWVSGRLLGDAAPFGQIGMRASTYGE